MTRTNIDLDDDAVGSVMTRFGFATKRDAVNFALRQLAVEPLSREKALELEGTGWEGDLAGMREHRAS